MVQAKKNTKIFAVTERWDIPDRADREEDRNRMSPDELRGKKIRNS